MQMLLMLLLMLRWILIRCLYVVECFLGVVVRVCVGVVVKLDVEFDRHGDVDVVFIFSMHSLMLLLMLLLVLVLVLV